MRLAKLRSGAASLAVRNDLSTTAWGSCLRKSTCARFDESLKALQAGREITGRGGNHDGPVHLPAEVLKTTVGDGRHRAERLLVEVIPIHLVLEQLPPQLGCAAVESSRPSTCCWRDGTAPPAPPAVRWPLNSPPGWCTTPASRLAAARPVQARPALPHSGRAALPGCDLPRYSLRARFDNPTSTCLRLPGPPPDSSRPWACEQVRGRGSQLGKVVVDIPGPIRRVNRARRKLAQVSMPGTSTYRMSLKKSPSLRIRSSDGPGSASTLRGSGEPGSPHCSSRTTRPATPKKVLRNIPLHTS